MTKKTIDYPVNRSDANHPAEAEPAAHHGNPAPKIVKPRESDAARRHQAKEAESIRKAAEEKLSGERKREIEDAKTIPPEMLESMDDQR